MDETVLKALQSPDTPTVWATGRHGGVRTVPSIRQRLFARTVRDEQTGCLLRQYAKHYGYPLISIAGRRVLASRVVFYLQHGYLPEVVRHTCDQPLCLEPTHLVGGTHRDNVQDAIERGRYWSGPRVTECVNGHPNVPENRYKCGVCRPCALERARKAWERKKAQ